MNDLLRKEMKLSASLLSYLFIAFGLMFFLPGYPILCGAFFLCLGLFQSFQNAREAGDIVFSALLPVAKRDVVKGKYLFCCFIEACAFLLMSAVTLLRMGPLSQAAPYRRNALMTADPYALGMALVIFGLFNLIFIGGFFRTACKFGGPFVFFTVTAFLCIGLAEALPHFPGLEGLNAFSFGEEVPLQLSCLFGGLLIFLLMTLLSARKTCRRFEAIDL